MRMHPDLADARPMIRGVLQLDNERSKMKRLSILFFVVIVNLSTYAFIEENEMVKDDGITAFQPKPLDDDWSKWIVGDWEGIAESDVGSAKVWMKIELGLNGQFLLVKSESKVTGTSEEQDKYYKDTLNASNEEIEEFKSSAFRGFQIFTVDPKSGEIVGYLFDSMRCIAEGKGKRQGNKEIMEWKWSLTAQGATSVHIIEKVDNDRFTLNHKYILPDGNKMEDKIVMTRTQ